MKESEIFKNEKAVLKNKIILTIQANVKRIKGLLTAGNSENRTDGVIYFSEVVLLEKINAEVKKEIVGINTNGQVVDIIETTGDGSTYKGRTLLFCDFLKASLSKNFKNKFFQYSLNLQKAYQ